MATDVDGHPIAWREAGHGDLIVLLHGLGGSRISWEPQLAALSTDHRVAAWDLPGYGASAPLADETVTFAALAQAAARWIAELGGGSAHIIGISMGAMIAQYLAASHPQSVRSLTLLSTSPAFGLDGTSPDDWRAARMAPLNAGQQPADFADRVLRSIAGPNIDETAFESQRRAMTRISGQALQRSIECLVTHDARPLLAAITAPTLVMVGELDQETPPSYAQALADQIPNAWLQIVPNAGHLLNVEAPDVVNAAITRHLRHVEDQ
ncbi:MAG: alpha/beta hydrolase [Actinomycetia bacterium]|nr:alpha/beta hydrolase [Actinomycetes bacterium]